MRENSPCKDCTDRHTACHGSCEKYKAWQDRYHAQQKHLADSKKRWSVPMTSAREKAYSDYRPDRKRYSKGGCYE